MAAKEFEKSLSFPSSIFTAINVSLIYLVILTPMVSAFIIGSDYSLGTWKMILPREPRRHVLLAAKLITLCAGISFLLTIALIFVHVSSTLCSVWLDVSFMGQSWQVSVAKQATAIGGIALVSWCLTVSVLLTIITRSVFLGSSLTFIVLILFRLLSSQAPEYISMWLVTSHLENLFPQTETDVNVQSSLAPYSLSFRWGVIAGSILLNLLVSFVLLKRQEFAET